MKALQATHRRCAVVALVAAAATATAAQQQAQQLQQLQQMLQRQSAEKVVVRQRACNVAFRNLPPPLAATLKSVAAAQTMPADVHKSIIELLKEHPQHVAAITAAIADAHYLYKAWCHAAMVAQASRQSQ